MKQGRKPFGNPDLNKINQSYPPLNYVHFYSGEHDEALLAETT